MTSMRRPHVIVLPGFSRRARDVDVFVGECSGWGWDVHALTLAPPVLAPLYMSTRRLRRIARSVAQNCAEKPIVIVGHSAGAAAGCFLACELAHAGSDVRGLVMADGVDSPNHLIARTLPDLEGLRVSAVLAPPSPCNRQGELARMLSAVPWVRASLVDGAGHGNFEGADIPLYRRVCRDDSTAEVARGFRQRVREDIRWVLGGDQSRLVGTRRSPT